MKRIAYLLITIIVVGSVFINCKNNQKNSEKYKQSIREWRQERLQNLKADDGWLNLAGLFWLEKGENIIGSEENCDIRFPDKAPEKLGAVYLEEETIKFEVAEDVRVTHKGNPVKSMELKSDKEEEPSVLQYESLKWFIIERDGEFGIRLRDLESPLVEELDSIPSFPVRQEWKIQAEYIPYDEEKTIQVPNVLGNTNKETIHGELRFKINGEEYKLYPLGSRESLFLVFGDDTNAKETYGGGRFLSVKEPDKDNITYIDFNKAYNPPCAFTPYATCPLPPRDNILPIKIQAGEKIPEIDVPEH